MTPSEDDDRIDVWLRQAMSAEPVPSLTAGFERRLERRLRPRARLRSMHRWALVAYALAAVLVSIWSMREASLEWQAIVLALLVPSAVAPLALKQVSAWTSI